MKRKYADGGLVVSRGYDAGLGNIRLMDMPDVSLAPSAAMAADRMASDDTVAARPSMKELQDANLKAVREREARETAPARRRVSAAAPVSRRVAESPAKSPPKDDAKIQKTPSPSSMSSVIRNLDSGYDIDAEARKIMAKRNKSFFSSPVSMKEARELARAEAEGVRRMSALRSEREKQAKSLAAGRKANPNLVDRIVKATMNPGYAKGGSVKKADAMKKMPAKAMPKKAMPMAMKKAMPMAAMMAKKPAKKGK